MSRAEHPRSRAERPRSHAEHPRSHAQRHLFLAGCPRSGTSALAFLLNEHPRLAIGFERFKRVRAQLDPFQFTPAQFFAPVTAETDIRGELLYARLRARWESGTVGVVGDKVPLYTRVLPQLLARFPAARVVVIVRDPLAVARSFRRRAADPEDWWPVENDHRLAIAMWNEALSCVREVQASWGGEGEEEGRAALLPYDALFAGDERWLGALCGFIGVPLTARLRAEHRRLALAGSERASESKPQAHVRTPESDRALDAASEPAPEPDHMSDSELEAYVRAHVDRDLEAWAHERMERQLRTIAPAGAPDPGEDEPPLSAGEVEEREREREQLLAQMRRPGRRGVDELEVLERRFVEQAGELARRGERLARPPGPGVPKPRITFVLPHQRATTGGVYVIEQFARHLASVADVSLAVREPALRPVAGVEVLAVERLEGPALPRADVLVYPADLRDGGAIFGLPARTGRPVMLFQGYGTPGSPVVEANLARAAEAVAVARWLHDLALGRGIPCAYVPEGLDRGVFSPGPPQSERPPRISLMTHRLDWKGLADALAAVAIVRARRPEVKLALFGTEPLRDAAGGDGVTAVGGATTFLASPTRPQVAELLRASAVHVLASWEEGFGLTGAEAIACGAALATTDTKGSRDYAIDGHTALVSAPRDPAALARNVLALLDDAPLRARLVGAGQRHLRTAMPPWQEAARRLAFALLEA
ncbi:MAG TPA: glycosyltransferase [Solirubrobacteraceae bacterium]